MARKRVQNSEEIPLESAARRGNCIGEVYASSILVISYDSRAREMI